MTDKERAEFLFMVVTILGIFHCFSDALKRALKVNKATLGALAAQFRKSLKQLNFFLDCGSIDEAFFELGSIVTGIELFLQRLWRKETGADDDSPLDFDAWKDEWCVDSDARFKLIEPVYMRLCKN